MTLLRSFTLCSGLLLDDDGIGRLVVVLGVIFFAFEPIVDPHEDLPNHRKDQEAWSSDHLVCVELCDTKK